VLNFTRRAEHGGLAQRRSGRAGTARCRRLASSAVRSAR
jgi:hypothetical protein